MASARSRIRSAVFLRILARSQAVSFIQAGMARRGRFDGPPRLGPAAVGDLGDDFLRGRVDHAERPAVVGVDHLPSMYMRFCTAVAVVMVGILEKGKTEFSRDPKGSAPTERSLSGRG